MQEEGRVLKPYISKREVMKLLQLEQNKEIQICLKHGINTEMHSGIAFYISSLMQQIDAMETFYH